METLIRTELNQFPLFSRGKVRDVYDLGDKLLIIATDRISVFDYVLPTPIPEKGKILTEISVFWFNYLKRFVNNHLISSDVRAIVLDDNLTGRTMLVRKAKRIDVECIVRGYISGSGWKEYQKSKTICGIRLPDGLKESEKLAEPIFTPATKAPPGEHDTNITKKQLEDLVGKEVAEELQEKSILLYQEAAKFALERNIIIADTKFEFGFIDGEICLIDEVLTPDSSRFWDKNTYQIGKAQDSFDKQFVRDYLEKNWDKKPPAPELPPEIVAGTRQRYIELKRRLIG